MGTSTCTSRNTVNPHLSDPRITESSRIRLRVFNPRMRNGKVSLILQAKQLEIWVLQWLLVALFLVAKERQVLAIAAT